MNAKMNIKVYCIMHNDVLYAKFLIMQHILIRGVSNVNFNLAQGLSTRDFAFIFDIDSGYEDFPFCTEIYRLSCHQTFKAFCKLMGKIVIFLQIK